MTARKLAKDAQLGTIDGSWWEVELFEPYVFEDGTLGRAHARRRFVSDLGVAESMVVMWLDGTEATWDAAFGDVGVAPWAR